MNGRGLPYKRGVYFFRRWSSSSRLVVCFFSLWTPSWSKKRVCVQKTLWRPS